MEREFWSIANKRMYNFFSGILTQFNMFELEHERKRAKLGGDYEFVKMLCKL